MGIGSENRHPVSVLESQCNERAGQQPTALIQLCIGEGGIAINDGDRACRNLHGKLDWIGEGVHELRPVPVELFSQRECIDDITRCNRHILFAVDRVGHWRRVHASA